MRGDSPLGGGKPLDGRPGEPYIFTMEIDRRSVSVRPATPDDLEGIHAVERRAHPSPWSREAIRSELRKSQSRFLLLTDDETDTEIVGYVCYWILGTEGEILNVAVDLPFRKKGFGRKLVGYAVDE